MLSQTEIEEWLHNNVPMMGNKTFKHAVASLQDLLTTACQQAQGTSAERVDMLKVQGIIPDINFNSPEIQAHLQEITKEVAEMHDNAKPDIPTAPAEKKPLSEITDEDAIEVGKLYDNDYEWTVERRSNIQINAIGVDKFKRVKRMIIYTDGDFIQVEDSDEITMTIGHCVVKIIDYLRSRNYSI